MFPGQPGFPQQVIRRKTIDWRWMCEILLQQQQQQQQQLSQLHQPQNTAH